MEAEQLVIATEVARREDGLVLTFHFDDGHVEEYYMSVADARKTFEQLDAQLERALIGEQ